MIRAEIIADSISKEGKRLTTFKLRYPRFIHAELMTHRMLSRNASSSRAVPVAKLLEEVRDDELRAQPIHWGMNQKGMQAAVENESLVPLRMVAFPEEGKTYHGDYGVVIIPYHGGAITNVEVSIQDAWREAAHRAADMAEAMDLAGYHKQIVNRVLEPFTHINVVVSATEWDNFFGLRLHKDAQPEFQALARAMWQAMQESIPEELQPGEWHLPFIETQDRKDARDYMESQGVDRSDDGAFWSLLCQVSTARCARVSFRSHETDKRSTVEEDLKLFHEKLFRPGQPLHASPAEHQATPDEVLGLGGQMMVRGSHFDGVPWANWNQHGNFIGWVQHRKTFQGEAQAELPEEFR